MPLTAGYLRSQGVVPWNDRQGTVVSIDGQIVTEKWTDPSTIDADGIGSDAGPDSETVDLTIDGAFASGGIATLSPARNVIITVTHGSSIVACNGIIYGYDIYGNAITEAWAVTATGTSKTSVGKKAFKKVTQITITAATDASANTVAAGDGKKLGLSYVALNVGLLLELEDTSVPTAGVIVAGSTAADTDYRGTYTPNSTLNGALDFTIAYQVDPTVGQFKGSTA